MKSRTKRDEWPGNASLQNRNKKLWTDNQWSSMASRKIHWCKLTLHWCKLMSFQRSAPQNLGVINFGGRLLEMLRCGCFVQTSEWMIICLVFFYLFIWLFSVGQRNKYINKDNLKVCITFLLEPILKLESLAGLNFRTLVSNKLDSLTALSHWFIFTLWQKDLKIFMPINTISWLFGVYGIWLVDVSLVSSGFVCIAGGDN